MNNSEISRWSECMASLPDKQFFNIIRLYLGEVKTPYNKQRLVSQLASFIRNESNLQHLVAYLDEFDIQVLTAISIIPRVTQEILLDFFTGTYDGSELFGEIINLKERLIIYGEKDEYSSKQYLFINPFLHETLQSFLKIGNILKPGNCVYYSMEDSFAISPNFLAAFISYFKIRGISCKADGTIKKFDLNHLEEIFPGKSKCIQLLMNAFTNIGLCFEGSKSFELDIPLLKVFAELPQIQQYAFLCAASVSRFSREGLRKEAQLLIDCFSQIPESGYTRTTILRLTFLTGTFSEDGKSVSGKSRFTKMLESARASASSIDELQSASILDRMIDSAVEFGLLQKVGKDENGEEIFKSGELIPLAEDSGNLPKVINLDSTSTVTLMPGLSLKTLLPFTSFLLIKKCGVVTEFEVTRQSISCSFDDGWTPDLIFEELKKYSYYDIPQNLRINIQDWYSSYSAATLYRGYILKVADSNITLVENNPNIKKFIQEKLTDGIYLLNIPVTEDISDFISLSGMEFLGNVKTSSSQNEVRTLPELNSSRRSTSVRSLTQNPAEEKVTVSLAKAAELLSGLKTSVEKMTLNPQQKEFLMNRISNRLILSESQLTPASIRIEILEADGMDFAGKIHLIETAMKEEDLLEVTLPGVKNRSEYFTIIGTPLQVSRQLDEAVMRLQVEPTRNIEVILVGTITHLRRIHS